MINRSLSISLWLSLEKSNLAETLGKESLLCRVTYSRELYYYVTRAAW